MNLRFANLLLLAGTLLACAWLWQRDLAARGSLEAADAALAALRSELAEARRATAAAREDLQEVRDALARSQARAEELGAGRAADRREQAAREARWSEVLASWKAAAEARDRRIAELMARERELAGRLETAARRLAEAEAR
jgi:chromosome segregation ATPase